jgi:hypothetical protein
VTCHLILPDAHSKPGECLNRFTWFGKLVNDLQPDVVINIGDFFDMESLCSYDTGTGYAEGRRVKKDLEAGWQAQDLLMQPIIKRKRRKPRFVALEGNHEYRLTKAVDRNSTLLQGIVDYRAFGWTEAGWEYYPYKGDTPAIVGIDGLHYTHFTTTAATNRAMSGMNIGNSILSKAMRTVIQGHNHIIDFSRKVDIAGNPQWGVSVGCYIEDLNSVRYAGTGALDWWAGAVYIEGINNSSFDDIQFISMNSIKKEYS